MKTPVRGSEDEVNRRVKELINRGWRQCNEPKLMNSGNYKTMPSYYVIMEYVGKK